MFNVEMKLKTLKDTPYSGTTVDEEIENDIVNGQKDHDGLFVKFKSRGMSKFVLPRTPTARSAS